MDEVKDYLWLVKTVKGDFFVTVIGKWTQEEAAEKLQRAFKLMQLDITGMIPRKSATGSHDAGCTIYEQEDTKTWLGFDFLAGRKLWQACGRGTEYEAELIKAKKDMKRERENAR